MKRKAQELESVTNVLESVRNKREAREKKWAHIVEVTLLTECNVCSELCSIVKGYVGHKIKIKILRDHQEWLKKARTCLLKESSRICTEMLDLQFHDLLERTKQSL